MQDKQSPIPSGFGPRTTAQEALAGKRLDGRTAMITGGYSGLGLEAARVLADAGATVIVPARTPDKARSALAAIARVEIGAMDLLDPASIDRFAQEFLASDRPLDMLITSAGIMATPLTRDARGYEAQFAANHLGHYQLTARLLPALRRAGNARVVSVSSAGHRFSGVDFDDPNFERRDYDKWKAYGQSKTANALFALHLDTLGAAHGVHAFSVHPGSILSTDLARHLSVEELQSFGIAFANGKPVLPAHFKTVEQGAATLVWCAVSEALNGRGGEYCENCDIAAMTTPQSTQAAPGVAAYAVDAALAESLFGLSERLTGVALSF
jgi:NAD(P)-dependent dehydrogenase (short-subunit alcohol dehydrogenase family)